MNYLLQCWIIWLYPMSRYTTFEALHILLWCFSIKKNKSNICNVCRIVSLTGRQTTIVFQLPTVIYLWRLVSWEKVMECLLLNIRFSWLLLMLQYAPKCLMANCFIHFEMTVHSGNRVYCLDWCVPCKTHFLPKLKKY